MKGKINTFGKTAKENITLFPLEMTLLTMKSKRKIIKSNNKLLQEPYFSLTKTSFR